MPKCYIDLANIINRCLSESYSNPSSCFGDKSNGTYVDDPNSILQIFDHGQLAEGGRGLKRKKIIMMFLGPSRATKWMKGEQYLEERK